MRLWFKRRPQHKVGDFVGLNSKYRLNAETRKKVDDFFGAEANQTQEIREINLGANGWNYTFKYRKKYPIEWFDEPLKIPWRIIFTVAAFIVASVIIPLVSAIINREDFPLVATSTTSFDPIYSVTPINVITSTPSPISTISVSTDSSTAIITDTSTVSTNTLAPIFTLTNPPMSTPYGTQIAILTLVGSSVNPVTSNAQWTPISQIINEVEMVFVPVGCFDMGSETGNADEQPINRQCFDQPFWIDRTEVTNKQFADLGGEAAYQSNWMDDNRPRENITWFEARDFCVLRDARLPTEAEWEYAARGLDSLKYPWGKYFVGENAVYGSTSDNQTAVVGSKANGVSWVGAIDLSGNVWEWVSSAYQPYPYNASDGREGNVDRTDVERVLRGGSWSSGEDDLVAAHRTPLLPPYRENNIGFRCVRSSIPNF